MVGQSLKQIEIYSTLTSLFLQLDLHFFPQIGMILADQVDVGMAAFYATADRGEVVDLSSVIDVAQ